MPRAHWSPQGEVHIIRLGHRKKKVIPLAQQEASDAHQQIYRRERKQLVRDMIEEARKVIAKSARSARIVVLPGWYDEPPQWHSTVVRRFCELMKAKGYELTARSVVAPRCPGDSIARPRKRCFEIQLSW